MQKFFITLGAVFILIGLTWPIVKSMGLGHLPGDFVFKKGHVTLYLPIMTCIIISLLISILWWLMRR